MRNTAHSFGNKLQRRSTSPLFSGQYLTPDAYVNEAVRELRLQGRHDLADRLSPVGLKWWDEPWQAREVAAWESAVAEAVDTDGLGSTHKQGLRHVLEILGDWLTEYDLYEQADWEDEKATLEAVR